MSIWTSEPRNFHLLKLGSFAAVSCVRNIFLGTLKISSCWCKWSLAKRPHSPSGLTCFTLKRSINGTPCSLHQSTNSGHLSCRFGNSTGGTSVQVDNENQISCCENTSKQTNLFQLQSAHIAICQFVHVLWWDRQLDFCSGLQFLIANENVGQREIFKWNK